MQMVYNGHAYSLTGQTIQGGSEEIPGSFAGYSRAAYKGNGVVFACMEVRASLFSEARFKFRQLRSGRPGDLFGNQDLLPLEEPWSNGTTGDLLVRMEQDYSLAGNFYARVTSGGLQRMQPDWVHIILGSNTDPEQASLQLDAEVLGYAYYPGGPTKPGVQPVLLDVSEVVHYAPRPDPEARFRGMSWITPIVREIQADSGYTDHKLKYLEGGATPNLIMVLDKDVQIANAKVFEEAFRAKYENRNSFKFQTMFVGAGATPMPVGNSFREMDFKVTQGAGETRIAAAAGTPPVLVGLSEGLQGSSLNEGNYAMARRRFADITMRPLWRSAAAALAPAVKVPANAELWYDDRDISALQEDMKDAAEISQYQATTMKMLVDSGWEPDSVVDAVLADDYGLLKGNHTGLFSVQLQPPSDGANGAASGDSPTNGSGGAAAVKDAVASLVKA
jgi:hypothetical protein